MKSLLIPGSLQTLLVAALEVVQPTSGRAGAALAAGRLDEAAEIAQACMPSPECALVLGRAWLGIGRLDDAARALAGARSGPLAAHAAKLEGEALLLARRPAEALEPLRAAAAAEPDGPAGARAAALLADALLAAGDFRAAAEQASRAGRMPAQPAEIRTGLDLVRAEALSARADGGEPAQAREAAAEWRTFWLEHPEHPASAGARAEEARLAAAAGAPLPEPTGRELLARAQRLLSAGRPGAAVAQAEAAVKALRGTDAAEANLILARALAADGRRTEAAPALTVAWQSGPPRVAAPAGLLLARDRARRGNDAEAVRLLDELARKYRNSAEAEESAYLAARLQLDQGNEMDARKRLARLARKRSGPHASDARWALAWLSYRRGLRDASERFAEFAASADSDAQRAQGLYWRARSSGERAAAPLFRRVVELDGLGWYGLLARQRLGQVEAAPAPFPPPARAPASVLPARLAAADALFRLGLLGEAGAEADRFVRQHPRDAALALPVYERARRYDRSVALAEALLGGRMPRSKAPRPLLEAAYPAAYADQVGASGARAGVDPYLLLAVARRESLFRPDTRSSAGAVGLMQLLPATARRAAVVVGRPSPSDADMSEPRTAIDMGAWYLSELLGRFGDPAVAAAAYNAGPRIAAPWTTRGAGVELDRWVEEIPYRETRGYVKVVMGAWSAYRILAGGSPPALSETVPAPKPGAAF